MLCLQFNCNTTNWEWNVSVVLTTFSDHIISIFFFFLFSVFVDRLQNTFIFVIYYLSLLPLVLLQHVAAALVKSIKVIDLHITVSIYRLHWYWYWYIPDLLVNEVTCRSIIKRSLTRLIKEGRCSFLLKRQEWCSRVRLLLATEMKDGEIQDSSGASEPRGGTRRLGSPTLTNIYSSLSNSRLIGCASSRRGRRETWRRASDCRCERNSSWHLIPAAPLQTRPSQIWSENSSEITNGFRFILHQIQTDSRFIF